jgi:hypothetical protein
MEAKSFCEMNIIQYAPYYLVQRHTHTTRRHNNLQLELKQSHYTPSRRSG